MIIYTLTRPSIWLIRKTYTIISTFNDIFLQKSYHSRKSMMATKA